MTIYAVYAAENGLLVSVTTAAAQVAPAEQLAARGHAVAERPDSEAGGVWNRATLSFDPRPAEPRMVSKVEFLRRFTVTERIPIRQAAKTDPVIEDFMDMLDAAEQGVDLDDPDVVAGIGYLVASELLTQQRAGEVLA